MQAGKRKSSNTVNLTPHFTKWITLLSTMHFSEVSTYPIFRWHKKVLKNTFSATGYSNISFLIEVLSIFHRERKFPDFLGISSVDRDNVWKASSLIPFASGCQNLFK